jgi:hypothetical protein
VLEEIVEESPIDLLAQDLIETYNRVNSLCDMIVGKYGLNDEESVDEEYSHEEYCVENPIEVTQVSTRPAREEKGLVCCNYTDGFVEEPLDVVGEHISSYILGDVDGIRVVSFLMEIPSTMLRAPFGLRIHKFFLWRVTFHKWAIRLFGSLMLI